MANTSIGAQLFTLRDFIKTPKDVAATFAKLKQIGYDAVQVSAMGPIDPKELKSIADGEGLTIAATHGNWNRMVDEPNAVIDEHALWNCKYTAIGCVPQEYMNAEGFVRFAHEATAVARRLIEGGLVFGYHNHGLEFERFDGKTGMEMLIENSDPELVTFEIDTYWVQFGGGDPAQWIRKVAGRMPLVHFKDMVGKGWEQQMAEVGEGNLNWPAILDACKEAGAVWHLIEQDICQRDPFDSLAISLRNVKAMGLV